MTAFKAQKDLICLFLPPSLYTSRNERTANRDFFF
jgi:hypothetical protein